MAVHGWLHQMSRGSSAKTIDLFVDGHLLLTCAAEMIHVSILLQGCVEHAWHEVWTPVEIDFGW